MISACTWIPRGAAAAVPQPALPSAEDLEAMQADAAQAEAGLPSIDSNDDEESGEDEDEAEQLAQARAVAAALKSAGSTGAGARAPGGVQSLEDAMKELDMDNYDDGDEEDEGALARMLGVNNASGMYYDGDEDPYITLREEGDSDSDSEAEDLHIRPTDLLILAAKNEDDVSHLEVWLYEEEEGGAGGNLYVHHDVLLPAFPLAVAWMDCDPTAQRQVANMAAVGSMEPGIEVWDLDVLDAVEPVCTLGGAAAGQPEGATAVDNGGKKKKKKKKKKKAGAAALVAGSHEDAVLGLGWNREYRNVLASASADTTVKVWDVATQSCQHTLQHHRDKVQAVAWNPAEAHVLLSGGFDRQAAVADMRTPGGSPLLFSLSADVEALAWDPVSATCFAVTSEDGMVAAYDARGGAGSGPLFRLQAHDKAACAISFCTAAPGLLATGSTDKKVKLWNVAGNKPSLVAAQDMGVGAVFTAAFCPEAPHLLVAGGSKGAAAVWDVRASSAVRAAFKDKFAHWQAPPEQEAVQA